LPWVDTVPEYDSTFDGLYINLVVPTTETVRQSYLIDVHKHSLKGVMFAGIAGTGKTTIVKNYFENINPDTVTTGSISFNNYTDSFNLQAVILSYVEKRTGKI
jgi:SpoVK/Ycf46/Vps4 family AAA+-type ATPase